MGCCGPKTAPIVAVIGFVLDILFAIFFFLFSPLLILVLLFLVFAFCYLMVVFGHIYRKASLFLPFFALKPLGLIVGVLLYLMFLFSIILINMQKNGPSSLKWSSLTDGVPFIFIFMLVIGIIISLHAWFYSIIFRAYVLIKEKSAPDNVNSEGYEDVAAGPTCCCGPCRAKIETAIPVVALVGFFFQLSGAGMVFLRYVLCSEHCFVELSFGLMCLVSSIAYLVVLFAQRKRNPSLFLPYLIIMPIAKIASVSYCILLFFALIKEFNYVPPPDKYSHIPSDEGGPRDDELLVILLPLLFLFSITLFHTWFYSIIFRAYKKTKQQQKSASFIANSSISRAEESRVGP